MHLLYKTTIPHQPQTLDSQHLSYSSFMQSLKTFLFGQWDQTQCKFPHLTALWKSSYLLTYQTGFPGIGETWLNYSHDPHLWWHKFGNQSIAHSADNLSHSNAQTWRRCKDRHGPSCLQISGRLSIGSDLSLFRWTGHSQKVGWQVTHHNLINTHTP